MYKYNHGKGLAHSQTGCDCEGFHRRDFIKIGVLGLFGLGLRDFFWLTSSIASENSKNPNGFKEGAAKSVVLIWMAGGPSHLDLWDLKPEAPEDIRGTFKPTRTNVSGIGISEHLPLTAQQMDKICLIRSMTSPEGAHERGTHYMMTGFQPLPGFAVPSYGSVTAKLLAARSALPPYIAIPSPVMYGGAGFLGAALEPFSPGGNPADSNFKVRDLQPPQEISYERVDRRRTLRSAVDSAFKKFEDSGDRVKTVDDFYQAAYNLLSSSEARAAFDLTQETNQVRDAYGRNSFGQSCLLARRLVEAGVRFVTVTSGGWDTHNNNFQALQYNLLPAFDRAYAAFIKDLAQRGLLDSTLVICMGEFGRTPKINTTAGRDHHPRVFSMTLAGGGIKGGQVIGASDPRGLEPVDKPVRPEDLSATIYHCLGIDYSQSLESPDGVRIVLSRGGQHIKEALL